MPTIAKSTCSSDFDCNGEGKCVLSPEDGTYFCDCTIGYIEPHCKNRDPCLLEGNVACQNGSTCKRKSNFEYECKCRVPYDGEFCETYDLCEVDVDECIEDLNVEDPSDPICNPCIPQATCNQISKRHYTCDCEAGANHSTCYAYPNSNTRNSQAIDHEESLEDSWNPIIPSIALTSCCLYIIIFIIVLIFFRKRKKLRPRLIVCCDINQFDDLSYYLISVETGRQWNAGTNCSVYCFICGENGQAGPFPLYDLNLSEVYTLQRCQEDNYLVSHPDDLGRIEKIVLWYDNRERTSSWFCEKITVRNIKTEQNWHFYSCLWLYSRSKNRRYEFPVATQELVRRKATVGVDCQHFGYQIGWHHSYIAPFINITPEIITLMFAEWMSYMLILIALYGFITMADFDISHTYTYEWTEVVAINGSLAALFCFSISLILASLFLAFSNEKTIPTLLVWHNKPGMSECELSIKKDTSKSTQSSLPLLHTIATNTDTQLLFDALTHYTPRQIHEDESDTNQSLFRIPSTDLVHTEDWVEDSVNTANDSPDHMKDPFVHGYQPYEGQLNLPEAVLNYGMHGGLVDGRQQESTRFVYTSTSNDGSSVLRNHIDSDLREMYAGMNLQPPRATESNSQDSLSMQNVYASKSPSVSRIYFNENGPEDDSTYPMEMGAGDFSRSQVSNTTTCEKRRKVSCELCEMDIDHCWQIMAKLCIIVGWILCFCLIVSATVICVIYGGRYGYQRTYDWIISLAICWLESFLAYQFLKVLVIVIITTVLVQRRELPSFEERKIQDRLQLYYVNGLTVLPEREPLKYVHYLPKYWIPAPYVKLHSSSTKIISNTSIKGSL